MRVFYVSIDGFDTHATQLPPHANLLGELSGAMTAFFDDMKGRGQGDRVLMMTFSEFGRRAKENGSKGTDHGSASQLFLVGGKVKAGVVGKHPSLTDLPQGNLSTTPTSAGCTPPRPTGGWACRARTSSARSLSRWTCSRGERMAYVAGLRA